MNGICTKFTYIFLKLLHKRPVCCLPTVRLNLKQTNVRGSCKLTKIDLHKSNILHALVCFILGKKMVPKSLWSSFSQEARYRTCCNGKVHAFKHRFILNARVVSINMQSQDGFAMVNAAFLFPHDTFAVQYARCVLYFLLIFFLLFFCVCSISLPVPIYLNVRVSSKSFFLPFSLISFTFHSIQPEPVAAFKT
jgi:hypothetical protein